MELHLSDLLPSSAKRYLLQLYLCINQTLANIRFVKKKGITQVCMHASAYNLFFFLFISCSCQPRRIRLRSCSCMQLSSGVSDLGEETPTILSMLSAKLVALLLKPATPPTSNRTCHACMQSYKKPSSMKQEFYY